MAYDRPSFTRGFARGAAGTATAAGVLFVLKELLNAYSDHKEDKKRQKKDDVSEDTMIVRVPSSEAKNKLASALDALDAEVAARLVRPRDLRGRFAQNCTGSCTEEEVTPIKPAPTPAEKNAGISRAVNYAGEDIGTLAGTLTTYASLSKLYSWIERQRLKREIAAAQQEYIDLAGLKKKSSAPPEGVSEEVMDFLFDDIAPSTTEKSAAPAHGGTIWRDAPRAVAALTQGTDMTAGLGLATLLTIAGLSAYTTRKVLHAKLDPREDQPESPRINHIVLKAASGERREISREELASLVKKAADEVSSLPDIDIYRAREILDTVTDPLGNVYGTPDYRGPGAWRHPILMREAGKVRDQGFGAAMEEQARRGNLTSQNIDEWVKLLEMPRYQKLLDSDIGRSGTAPIQRSRRPFLNSLLNDILHIPFIRRLLIKHHLRKAISAAHPAPQPSPSHGLPMKTWSTPNPPDPGLAPAKTAGAIGIGDLLAFDSRMSTVTDKRNKDLDQKLDAILSRLPQGGRRRKGKKPPEKEEEHVAIHVMDPEAAKFLKEHQKELERLFGSIGAEV